MDDIETYDTLEEYFKAHPDEEDDFYDDMATLAQYEQGLIEMPEDWVC